MSSRPGRVVLVGWALAVVAGRPLTAHADPPAEGSTLAEALFRQGRERMAARDYAAACPQLEESQRLDPQLGTLLNLAFCHGQEGRTATAWGEYASAAAAAQKAGRKDHEATARAALKNLDGQLSHLVLRAPGAPPGLVLVLDDQRLGSGALGVALPVDPGVHRLRVTASGYAAAAVDFRIPAAPATVTVDAPALVPTLPILPPGPISRADPTLSTSPAPTSAPSSPDAQARSSPAGPWVLGGLAVAAAAAGTYFGLEAFAHNHQASQACTRDDQCPQSALDTAYDGKVDAAVSTVTFAAAVGLAAGAVLWLVVRRDAPASTRAALRPSAARLEMSF